MSAKHDAAEKLLKLYKSDVGVAINSDTKVKVDDAIATETFIDFKSELLQFCIDHKYPKPAYKCVKDIGPSHAREFTIRCIVGSANEEVTMDNKKEGEQMSAEKMLEELKAVRTYCVNCVCSRVSSKIL